MRALEANVGGVGLLEADRALLVLMRLEVAQLAGGGGGTTTCGAASPSAAASTTAASAASASAASASAAASAAIAAGVGEVRKGRGLLCEIKAWRVGHVRPWWRQRRWQRRRQARPGPTAGSRLGAPPGCSAPPGGGGPRGCAIRRGRRRQAEVEGRVARIVQPGWLPGRPVAAEVVRRRLPVLVAVGVPPPVAPGVSPVLVAAAAVARLARALLGEALALLLALRLLELGGLALLGLPLPLLFLGLLLLLGPECELRLVHLLLLEVGRRQTRRRPTERGIVADAHDVGSTVEPRPQVPLAACTSAQRPHDVVLGREHGLPPLVDAPVGKAGAAVGGVGTECGRDDLLEPSEALGVHLISCIALLERALCDHRRLSRVPEAADNTIALDHGHRVGLDEALRVRAGTGQHFDARGRRSHVAGAFLLVAAWHCGSRVCRWNARANH